MNQLISRVRWVWVLIGWTLFLWLSRLRNVVNNEELTSSGRAIRIGVVVIFVALAGLSAVAVRQMRASAANTGLGNTGLGNTGLGNTGLGNTGLGPGGWQAKMVGVFVAWTAGYWLIRGIGILVDGDYSIGFKMVHTVLMAVSLIFAFLTARSVQA